MRVHLDSILKLPVFADADLYLPPSSQSLTVSNIMIMEGHDVEHWVTPNEMIVTSLINYSKENSDEFVRLFQSLANLKCSGVIIKLGRYVDNVPQTLKGAASQLNLPLIVVGAKIQYQDILYQVMSVLFDETNRQLRFYRTVNQTFIQLLNESASTSKMLETLGMITHSHATIVTAIQYSSRECSGNKSISSHVLDETVKQLKPNELRNRIYYQHTYTIDNVRYHEVLTQLEIHGASDLFLCVVPENDKLQHDLYIAIETATTLISLNLNIQLNIKNAKRRQIDDSIDLLLSGVNIDRSSLPVLLEEQHFTPETVFRLIYCEVNACNEDTRTAQIQDQFRQEVLLRLRTLFPNTLYRIWPNRILFIIATEWPTKTLQEKLVSICQSVNQTGVPMVSIRVAISDKATFTDFRTVSEQCQRILSLAKVLYQDSAVSVVSRDDLGIYQLLSDKELSSATLQALIPNALLSVERNDPNLVETLETYINHEFNITSSAKALFIHPKTMRYRLNKLRDKYGISLDNTTQIANISIGIKLLTLI